MSEVGKRGFTDEKLAEPQLSEQEVKDRLAVLASLAKTVGKDSSMNVRIGKKPGWRYSFKPVNAIDIDPTDIRERGLDYCRGIICHEGAHRRVSRLDFVDKSLWQTTGFSFLLNAVEDPRVNNWVAKEYAGAQEWLDSSCQEDYSEEKQLETASREKMGYVPKHIRFGLEIIRHWHTGEIAKETPAEVVEILNKTLDDARGAYGILPGNDPKEEGITRAAKQSFEIVRNKIWPKYKKLVDEAKDEEALRQLIKDLIDKGALEIPPEAMSGGGSEPLPLSEIPDDIRKQIEEKVKKALDEMNEEEKEKLLSNAEKKSKEILDELDTELNEELGGKMSEQPETAHEAKERAQVEMEEKVKRDNEQKDKAETQRKKAEAERNEYKNKSEYDKAFTDVASYIEPVAEDILNAFAQKRHPAFRPGFPGQKLRLRGAMRYEGEQNYKDLFERRLSTERPEYDISLLVDLSGSMQGEKIKETYRGAVLFAEVLARVSDVLSGAIKFSVSGFQDTLIDYKKDDEEFGQHTRNKMNIMPAEVNNEGAHNRANYNNDGYCVDTAYQRLQKLGARKKIIIVLSDGQPAGDGVHRVERYRDLNSDSELVKVVEDISVAGDTALVGIGLGADTEHVANYYKSSLSNVENIPNVDIKHLTEVIGEVLKNLLNS